MKTLASLRSAAARAAWQNSPRDQLAFLLLNLIRSTVTLWLSCAAGRTAYCLQSRIFDWDFKWWLGGVVGFFASFISLIDSWQSRVELIEFNAGYVIHTEAVHMASRTGDVQGASRFLSAVLLAVATAAHVASAKGKGLLLLPVLAKIWKMKE